MCISRMAHDSPVILVYPCICRHKIDKIIKLEREETNQQSSSEVSGVPLSLSEGASNDVNNNNNTDDEGSFCDRHVHYDFPKSPCVVCLFFFDDRDGLVSLLGKSTRRGRKHGHRPRNWVLVFVVLLKQHSLPGADRG